MRNAIAIAAANLAAFGLASGAASAAPKFDVPVDCKAGVECFVQQYPDMDGGEGVADPYCGAATYDGHKGTDIRVLSMRDVARGVPVLSMGSGKVLRIRDGVADNLLDRDEDATAVEDRECGNGIVIDHGDGYEAQYCHMKNGSIAVQPGDRVKSGERIGAVGASGMAQFPHIHVTIRRGNKEVDPATGSPLGDGCLAKPANASTLWSGKASGWLKEADSHWLGAGVAGEPPAYDQLVVDGAPAAATAKDTATVGWVWLANLRAGDRIHMRLEGPEGVLVAEETSSPMPRNRAVHMQYVGKRGAPAAGEYTLKVRLLRDGVAYDEQETSVSVSK